MKWLHEFLQNIPNFEKIKFLIGNSTIFIKKITPKRQATGHTFFTVWMFKFKMQSNCDFELNYTKWAQHEVFLKVICMISFLHTLTKLPENVLFHKVSCRQNLPFQILIEEILPVRHYRPFKHGFSISQNDLSFSWKTSTTLQGFSISVHQRFN